MMKGELIDKQINRDRRVECASRISNVWPSFLLLQMLIQNAIYGIVISVCLAFPILVIATGNIIVGALATFSLCCCTVCVIGVIPLGGWKLGVSIKTYSESDQVIQKKQ